MNHLGDGFIFYQTELILESVEFLPPGSPPNICGRHPQTCIYWKVLGPRGHVGLNGGNQAHVAERAHEGRTHFSGKHPKTSRGSRRFKESR